MNNIYHIYYIQIFINIDNPGIKYGFINSI